MRGDAAAHAFIEDVGDSGQGSLRAMSADAGGVALMRNKSIRYSVVGTIAGANLWDQAVFFNQLTALLITAVTFALATVTATAQRFSAAQISDWMTFKNMYLRNANVVSVSGTDAASATSSLYAVVRRYNPFDENMGSSQYIQDRQNAAEFRENRAQLPMAERLDGYTEVNLVNEAQATAVRYKVSFLFGPRVDGREELQDVGAAVVKPPSQI